MASDSEALAQLTRLLGGVLLAGAGAIDVQHRVDEHFERLVAGLLAEAAASDDVFDRNSALEFLQARISDLRGWLSESQTTRLLDALRSKIEAW